MNTTIVRSPAAPSNPRAEEESSSAERKNTKPSRDESSTKREALPDEDVTADLPCTD